MGPTAAGKTDLALELARVLPCDLISVDSALVYRGMDIGTAKPDKAVLAEFPHALIDIRDPANPVTTAWFNTWKGYDRAYGYSFFEGAIGVDLDVARQRVYIADSHRDLVILSAPSTLATR